MSSMLLCHDRLFYQIRNQLLHEWIWVELLYVPNAWLLPDALEEHHGTNHSWYTSSIAYALHASLVVCLLVLAVVVNIVCALLTILLATDTATDRGLAVIVLTEILWVRQYGFQELQWNDLHLGSLARAISQWSLVFNLVDTAHAEVLNAVEIGEILLTESHPAFSDNTAPPPSPCYSGISWE